MSQLLDYAIEVRQLLRAMEVEVGLEVLSNKERDVLYAVRRLTEGRASARSEAIRAHPLVATMTHPTYHRALRSLVEKGYLDHAPETLAGAYIIGIAHAESV